MPEDTSPYAVRIRTIGDVLGQEALQVWYYTTNTAPTGVADLLTTFKADVADHLLDIMSVQSHILSIDAQYVKGAAFFGTLLVGSGGNVSGDCLPPFVSWDFTLVRGGALERNGYKRLQGVPESKQADGIATPSAFADLNSLAGFMFADLDDGTNLYHPVIRRTRINRAAQVPPKYFSISSVLYSQIGTQNSRKAGHGR